MSSATVLAPSAPDCNTPLGLGRLSRGREMETAKGHHCIFHVTNSGAWVCRHGFPVSVYAAGAATARAQARAGEAKTGPGGPSAAVPVPTPETPARATTGLRTTGGRSGAPG